MDPLPVILDISSDEEAGLEEIAESFDYDWIKEFMDDSDKESDDSDEVIVVGEVKPDQKSKPSKPSVNDVDDDCVVLDADPENCVTSVNEAATESDELLVVGEKGQIACRDFPHPRHDCAKFPFSSTPHERYCDQCHCYVCDLLAPCLKWGTGISSTDHCHATNKAEMWKIQRNNLKLGKSAQLPVSNTALTQGSQAVGRTVVRACSSSRHSTLQKEDSMPNSILVRPSTTFSVPSGTNHGRCQRSGSTLARNRYQPHIISRQFLGVRNKAIQRDRRHGGGDSGPQFHRSCLIPRVVNNSGATVTVNHSGLGSSGQSNPIHPAEQYDRYHDATTGLSNVRDDNSWNDVWLTTNLSSYSQPSPALPSLNCVSGNTVTTQEFCQPLTQCNDSHNTYQSCVLSNEVHSHVACPDSSSNQHGNELQFRSQNENAGENIIHCGNPSQDTSQQQPHEGNQSRTGEKGDLLVLDASSTEPVIEDSHADVGSCISINQPPIVKESDVQCAGSTNLGAVDDIENWLFDKDSVVGVGDSNFSFLDMSSPDLSSIETGMLLF